MASNPFIGLDRATLEKARLQAQKELLSGMSAISGGIEGVQFGNIMTIGPKVRLDMILAALHVIDPVAYPINDITSPTRTVMTYRGPS